MALRSTEIESLWELKKKKKNQTGVLKAKGAAGKILWCGENATWALESEDFNLSSVINTCLTLGKFGNIYIVQFHFL